MPSRRGVQLRAARLPTSPGGRPLLSEGGGHFDNDADLENNHENYDARKGMWDEKYAYVHVVR